MASRRGTQALRQEQIDRYFDAREASFFSGRDAWRVALKLQHPRAEIVARDGVERAYVGQIKVGVFGSLPGHGYVLGTQAALIVHGKRARQIDDRAALGLGRISCRFRGRVRPLQATG